MLLSLVRGCPRRESVQLPLARLAALWEKVGLAVSSSLSPGCGA